MQIRTLSGGIFAVYEGRAVSTFDSLTAAHNYIRLINQQRDRKLLVVNKVTWGIKLSRSAWWLGAHYSKWDKRLCVNVLPCVALWIVWPGGNRP